MCVSLVTVITDVEFHHYFSDVFIIAGDEVLTIPTFVNRFTAEAVVNATLSVDTFFVLRSVHNKLERRGKQKRF